MKRRVKAKIKNSILLSITTVAIAVAMISVAIVDSNPMLGCTGLFISLVWLSMFAMANGYLDVDCYEEDE